MNRVFIESKKTLKKWANFTIEGRSVKRLANELKKREIASVDDIKHIASSAGMAGCSGQYYEIIGRYSESKDKAGAWFTFYTDDIYRFYSQPSIIAELNQLLTK